jgi:hypothetical protein
MSGSPGTRTTDVSARPLGSALSRDHYPFESAWRVSAWRVSAWRVRAWRANASRVGVIATSALVTRSGGGVIHRGDVASNGDVPSNAAPRISQQPSVG